MKLERIITKIRYWISSIIEVPKRRYRWGSYATVETVTYAIFYVRILRKFYVANFNFNFIQRGASWTKIAIKFVYVCWPVRKLMFVTKYFKFEFSVTLSLKFSVNYFLKKCKKKISIHFFFVFSIFSLSSFFLSFFF